MFYVGSYTPGLSNIFLAPRVNFIQSKKGLYRGQYQKGKNGHGAILEAGYHDGKWAQKSDKSWRVAWSQGSSGHLR